MSSNPYFMVRHGLMNKVCVFDRRSNILTWSDSEMDAHFQVIFNIIKDNRLRVRCHMVRLKKSHKSLLILFCQVFLQELVSRFAEWGSCIMSGDDIDFLKVLDNTQTYYDSLKATIEKYFVSEPAIFELSRISHMFAQNQESNVYNNCKRSIFQGLKQVL